MKLSKTLKAGKNVWRATWTDEDTQKRRFKQFKTQMAGNAWIAERKFNSYKHGSTIAAHDSRLLGSWIDLDALLRAKGGTLLQAGDLCLKMWSAKGVESVEDTLEVYLKDRKKIGK